MTAVAGYGSLTGTLHRHLSLNFDITGLAKFPQEKTDHLTLDSSGTVLSVAIVLCNKIELSFCA